MINQNPIQDNETCLFSLMEELRVIWEITYRCNYNCHHCCASAGAEDSMDLLKREMSFPEIKRALINLRQSGLSSLYISGGEPGVREDLFDVIDSAIEQVNPKNIKLATNGRFVDEKNAQLIAERNLGNVLVSLDGHSPEAAAEFRGPRDSFINAVSAIDNLVKKGIPPRIGVVIWSGNVEHLEDLVKIGINHGARDVFFNWLMPVGNAKEHPNLTVPISRYFEIAHILHEMEIVYKNSIGIGYHRFSPFSDNAHECQAGSRIIHILPDGKVTPCSWLYKNDHSFSSKDSIKDTPLEVIRNEPCFKRVESILEQRSAQGIGPGCLAVCKMFMEDYLAIDPIYKGKNFRGAWINEC